MQEKTLDPEHPDFANTLINRAVVLAAQARTVRREPSFSPRKMLVERLHFIQSRGDSGGQVVGCGALADPCCSVQQPGRLNVMSTSRGSRPMSVSCMEYSRYRSGSGPAFLSCVSLCSKNRER